MKEMALKVQGFPVQVKGDKVIIGCIELTEDMLKTGLLLASQRELVVNGKLITCDFLTLLLRLLNTSSTICDRVKVIEQ